MPRANMPASSRQGRRVGFPYWAYIGRFWQDYATVIRASSNAYPFNFANHQMLAVIGTSHTIEHAIQWAYENTIGRITEIDVGPAHRRRPLSGRRSPPTTPPSSTRCRGTSFPMRKSAPA